MIIDLVRTLAAVSVPIVVAVVGYQLNRRLKQLEADQWRNQELIKARLQYFGQLAPMLNDLMCYLTFIGRWKELTPPQVVAIKRDTDRLFFSVSPLFSQGAVEAYENFLGHCFETFGRWGADARIRSGFVRRREAAGNHWRTEWQEMFTYSEIDEIQESDLDEIRISYDKVLAALVDDVKLLVSRERYARAEVTINAH
ncbi:hypothetical protein [Actinophytocola sp.]|uniref:hypothetical protein n=1 Tax=Actinophytocola sp. TaxID=1872138 RepID=UPI003D6A688D